MTSGLSCGERPQSRNSSEAMPVNLETALKPREVSDMAYNKSSPGIHEQNAAKHTLAYAIWNGLMDRAEATDDTDALEAMHREAERVDVERERDGVTIDEVEFSYEQSLTRLRPRQPLASAVEPTLVQPALVRPAEPAQANRTPRPT